MNIDAAAPTTSLSISLNGKNIFELSMSNTFTTNYIAMLDLRLNIDNLLFIIMNPAKNISGANGYAESKFQARACKKCVAYNVYVTYYKLNL